jgi:hypothetical protein
MSNASPLHRAKAPIVLDQSRAPAGVVIRTCAGNLITLLGAVTSCKAGLVCCGAVWNRWQVVHVLYRNPV